MIHPKRHPGRENPCAIDNGGCEALCLINTEGRVGCRCPHRKKLQKDGKTCIGRKAFLFLDNSLYISTPLARFWFKKEMFI